MKKVRFESPIKSFPFARMDDSECHSPRPFIERHIQKHPELCDIVMNETQMKDNFSEAYTSPRIIPYNEDPIQRYDCSNSSPYPGVNKTCVPGNHQQGSPQWLPSNELELSLLDATSNEPRQPFCKPILKVPDNRNCLFDMKKDKELCQPVLSSIENKPINPPNILIKDNDFFIRRGNLDNSTFNINPLHNQFKKLSLDKENNPIMKKTDMKFSSNSSFPQYFEKQLVMQTTLPQYSQNCMCHHCIKVVDKNSHIPNHQTAEQMVCNSNSLSQCPCAPQPKVCTYCKPIQYSCKSCNCNNSDSKGSPKPQNAYEKKEWAVKMYQQQLTESMDIERQTNISKEKREPTVSDLFKIIKLQNEQLQLLQEKVDKFISGNRNVQTVQNTTEHIALNENEHKISIGVMTSFEMVRTSTIINKEVVKQTNDMSQLQCNKSHITVKEVVSNSQPVNVNFLEGIVPVEKMRGVPVEKNACNSEFVQHKENEIIDEKTLNELSLCNVHIDSTTPMMSPEPSLYLDVRDYSESEASSVDQSNIGWTYYNKVMTHVNGMLDDTDMPSTASALYRNARQQCMQMQIDKTNVSVTKRVKFGDDIHQPHIYAPSTDTSLKMNQLAAKYLKGTQIKQPLPQPKPLLTPTEMSLATRNYMERHKILQGVPFSSRSPSPNDIPKFLDITTLKQQPKFL